MPFRLTLSLEYQSDTSWRWVLSDADGRFLADHEVSLDPNDPIYEGFIDLPGHLRRYEDVRSAKELLDELGEWMGEKIFGAVGQILLGYEQSTACVVQMRVPLVAQNLLFRPFELAHVGGRPLAERAFRFIYTVAHDGGGRGGVSPKDVGPAENLRVLGVFSLPHDAAPLNLRQERYRLQLLMREFVQTRGRAVELRLLQYGATRQLLAEVIQEPPGWDVMHFSGHSTGGELILERPDGTADLINAEELTELLRPAGARLKLLTLLSCYSGTADVHAARAQVGLDNATAPASPLATSVLPGLGQRLAEELDCAVLAMRYPVLDDFASELALTLYDRLLEKRQPLPHALQLALADALTPTRYSFNSALARLTPLLFGVRAADLRLQAPPKGEVSFEQPRTGLFAFPKMPERFVGRLMPMLNASQALAPESGKTGVLFYGMAGAGKTACALELAHHYDPRNLERFVAFVWHKAPEEGRDIADSLTRFALSMESQLPGLKLIGLIDNPEDFRRKALPRLRGLLEENAILIVIDNLEGLLTSGGDWRDPRWGELVDVLLGHSGLSRLVLTSRRLPTALADNPRLQVASIHTLSFQESVLLARQLPNLEELFQDANGRDKLRRILRAAQGHPKLLELADGLAADPAALEAQLARDETADDDATARIAFFDTGRTDRPEDVFVNELRTWTEGVAQNLTPTAQLLAQFLARLEDADRTKDVVGANWEDFLKRLTGERAEDKQPAPEPALSQARAALLEPNYGLDPALDQLAQAGLIEIETTTSQETQITPESLQTLATILAARNPDVAALTSVTDGVNPQNLLPHLKAALAGPADPALQSWLSAQQVTVTRQRYRLHPGVAEALLRSSLPAVLNAADKELGAYFVVTFRRGIETEMQGGGQLVIEGARRAAPYLMRAGRWEETVNLLEELIQRDDSPQTLAFVTPLLRASAEHLSGTRGESVAAVALADALSRAGRYSEAEALLYEVVGRSRSQGNARLATVASSHHFNLLTHTGRFEEALKTIEGMVAYAREAGLGPWTRLSHESQRLRVLSQLGRYAEVLNAAHHLLSEAKDLPEVSSEEELVLPWVVRESLLAVGVRAALSLRQWDTALSLNSQLAAYRRQRGAPELEIARTLLNDYGPLLRLSRHNEARSLLERCRATFEQENALNELGRTYNALADLENLEGFPATAARFAQTALRYAYVIGDPDSCAEDHHDLAAYVEQAGGDGSESALAHRLAAGVIRVQIGSGALAVTVRELARGEMPPGPPSFDEVCALIERVEGVRFRELFERLPRRATDGDAAIKAVWEMAVADAATQAFKPGQQLHALLREFEPLLQAVAAGAHGDEQARGKVEETLPRLEEAGWHIGGPVRRIWRGEHDAEAITEGLDEADSTLVRRALELVSGTRAADPGAHTVRVKGDVTRTPPPDEGDLSSRARQFFENASFETRDLTPDTFFCVADRQVWENRFTRPIHTKPIYTECYLGRRLTRDAVNEIYERSKKVVLGRPEIVFVIFDQVPNEEGWIEIQALRRDVQIVPVDYAVIRQGLAQHAEAKELEKLLRRFLGKPRNLYNERHPIADSLSFFGRETRASELLAMLKSRRPVALFGLRKMGKSSLLKYLQNTADFPVAYIDLQFSSEPKEVFRKILEDWQAALLLRRPPLRWSHEYDQSDPFTSFAANARDLVTRLEASHPGTPLGILLDEIEVIAPSAAGAEGREYDEESVAKYLPFARALRGLVQETDAVALMVVGVDPKVNRVNRVNGKQNPFYQFFSEEYLGPLSHDDCVQMIRNIGSQMNIRYSDDAADCVAQLSGGHPFLARQLCSLIVESLKANPRRRSAAEGPGSVEEITMDDLLSAAEEFVRTPQTATLLNEEGLWGEVTDVNLWQQPLAEENRSLLIELARAGTEPEAALLDAGRDREARQDSLHGLKQRAVIGGLAGDFQNLLRIRMELFRDWIMRYQIGPRS